MEYFIFLGLFLICIIFYNKNLIENFKEISAYNYVQKRINNLNKVKSNSNNFYQYKNINFLSKMKKKSKYLVVSIHGAVDLSDKKLDEKVIFRGYNYNISNTDIICISDGLLNLYDKYRVGYCLSTNKHNFENVYLEIFNYYIKKFKYKKVIFIGSSAGGYPSIHFACKFNQYAIVSNAQLYLEKYVHFKDLIKNFGKKEKIIYKNNQIEEDIFKSKPKKIIFYNNKLDKTYIDHTLPFLKFLKNNNLTNIIKLNLFEGDLTKNKHGKPHYIFWDKDSSKSAKNILAEFLNEEILDNN